MRQCVCGNERKTLSRLCMFCEALTPGEYSFMAKGYKMNEATPDTKTLISSATKPTSKQEALGVDPKAGVGAAKAGVQWVPPAAIIAIDRALAEGRIKYGTAKWRETKTEAMTYVGGCLRHLMAWVDGEEIDPDSIVGKHHLDGAIASLAILIDAREHGTMADNRPPKGPAPKLLGGKK